MHVPYGDTGYRPRVPECDVGRRSCNPVDPPKTLTGATEEVLGDGRYVGTLGFTRCGDPGMARWYTSEVAPAAPALCV